jgi:signal transduction histidine kinase
MKTGLQRVETWPRQVVIFLSICFVTIVGWVDYVTGYETFFFTFYLLPVFIVTWRVSAGFGALMSALSVTAWISSNVEAGAHYSSYFVPVWNAGIMFAIYLIIVFLLSRVKKLNEELEDRVRERTAALTREIADRGRLQKELLETNDREQRRIGRELHDGLCQHLTGTALAGHLLAQKLASKSPANEGEAARLVRLVEEAIELTRHLSHQLDPVELKSGRLTDHFEDLAASTSQRFKVACQFEGRLRQPLEDAVATHLYRIAQETVATIVKRRGVTQIHIELDSDAAELLMSITDDGEALSEKMQNEADVRMRAATYRADLIGATLTQEPLATRGSRMTCVLSTGTQHHAIQD